MDTRPAFIVCGGHRLALDRPRVMAVLNVTPDSFSDGGRFAAPRAALERACAAAAQGVDVIDIGGESTRPGATPVSEAEELDRVVPVLELALREPALREVVISVDTRKPAVMRAAIAAGATMINDVSALGAPGALEAVAGTDVAVCLMHMQGEPATMQLAPHYDDVVAEVRGFLSERIAACERAGIGRERIVVDPGFGFGKGRAHNLALLRSLRSIAALGCSVLCGISRKDLFVRLPPRSPTERLAASLAAELAAVDRGAALLRVHDVDATVDALKVWGCAGRRNVSSADERIAERSADR